MRKCFWMALLLALLLACGCGEALTGPEGLGQGQPEYLFLDPPPSEVTLTAVNGSKLVLAPEARLEAVLGILGEAVFEADWMPERETEGEAAGRLTCTSHGGESKLYLYTDGVRYADKTYYLAPEKIEALWALFAEPPREPVEIEGLVLVSDLDDTIIIDLKYATTDNFTRHAVYPVAVAAIKRETGERLVRANRIFQRDGYTIKLWDAYRPWSAQHLLWEAFPDPRYVIKPEEHPPGSGFRARHNNGMAVDITLVDRHGNELEMPTAFDDFSEKAAPGYPHASAEARRNAAYLISVMESVGFAVAPTEWWHFNDVTGTPGPYLDIPLEAFLESQ